MSEPVPSSRRREKPILSCTFCRARKLRCDRLSPCETCIKRGKAAECTYPTPEQERKHAIDYRPHHGRNQARQRFARLENLVMEMRDRDIARSSRQTSSETVATSLTVSDTRSSSTSNNDAADDMGKLSLTDDQAVYTGSSHWVTILEDLRQLKDELSNGDEKSSSTTLTQEPGSLHASLLQASPATTISLINSAPSASQEQILAMVPPRKVVDRHISYCFNAFKMAPFILYRKRFLFEYSSFWEKPSSAPIMWIGLMFSLMALSALLQQQDGGAYGFSSAKSCDEFEAYRTATIQCLIAGDYLQQSRYTMETLLFYFAAEQNATLDASVSNWVLIGVIIRIAMRMGFHRDPSHWPDIRPLQAELRRRIWLTLYQLDFITSTNVGLPRIVNDSQCDTRRPAHLLESDLSLDHNQLPAERSFTEPTALLFMIERDAIIRVSAEIYDATEAGPPPTATIVALEAKLQRTIEKIPEWLRYRPPELSVTEDPATIVKQLFVDILIHKAVYLLHRRSFVKGSGGDESLRSIEICINAALAILEHQRRMNEETQPGGILFNSHWRLTSTANHEFLQATMMLCFALSKFNDGRTETTAHGGTLPRQDDIVKALKHARSLWERISDQSIDAKRAATAIATVLQRYAGVPSADITAPVTDGSLDRTPDIPDPSLFGIFDYGQDMALGAMDSSFLAVDFDITAFGSIGQDFMT